MNKPTKYAVSLALIGLTAGSAAALPAKPGLRTYTQPDGSIIRIELRGDHRHHAVFSEDGYLLLDNGKDGYEYAVAGPEDRPVASGILAASPEKRPAFQKELLEKIDRSRMLENLEAERVIIRRQAIARTPQIFSTRAEEEKPNRGLCEHSFPLTGSPKALVILVEYSDKKFELGENAHDYFDRMLNEPGFSDYGATGSVIDWFTENSKGQFTPEFDLYGPVTLPNTMRYYGQDRGNDEPNAHEMAIHACDILNPEVDFSIYDTDKDGFVDNIFIFYAGYGQADSGMASNVWPHSADIEFYKGSKLPEYDGVKINHYACSNEQPMEFKHPDGIGTFVHEFSHVMGLPDLYATSYVNSFTPGEWSALDYGPYNNEGRTPPNYSAYERYVLGWMNPRTFDYKGPYTLLPIDESNDAILLETEKENEYFLFENRQQQGNDLFIPGHGMLVWHIDYDEEEWHYNSVNNTPNHQYVDLVEADNRRSEYTRSGDSFPGASRVTSYDDTTVPALVSWARRPLGVALSNIREEGSKLMFDADVEGAPEGNGTNAVSGLTEGKHLRFEGRHLTGSDRFEVYDPSGRLIASGTEADLPAAGIYLIKSNGNVVKRAVR